MKLKQTYLFLSFVFLFVFLTNAIKVNAMNTGFSTEELSAEAKNTFLSNVNISLITEEPVKRGILCFDVNEQGMIAIGRKGSHGKEVCVYTTQGEFLYAYAFNCAQSFGVEWDNELINIYFLRSDVIISLDPNGNILDTKKVQNTIANNTHSNTLLYSTSRIVGDSTYLIRNDMGIFNWIASSYSQITITDSAGGECIIYDINSTQFLNTVLFFIVVITFVSVVIAIVISQFVKSKRDN